MRISQQMLENKIDQISNIMGIRFVPNFCYGAYGVQILCPNTAGGVRDFIGLGTKSETWYAIDTAINALSLTDYAKAKKDLISSCRHRDEFNRFEGKQNQSVMHEHTDKKGIKSYWCSGCHRSDLTIADMKKSCQPVTHKYLWGLRE